MNRLRITKEEFIKLVRIAKAYKVKLPWKLKRFFPEFSTPSYYDIWIVLINIPRTSFDVDMINSGKRLFGTLCLHDYDKGHKIVKMSDVGEGFNGSEFLDYLIFAIENKYYKGE